jgi:hypothetical protein
MSLSLPHDRLLWPSSPDFSNTQWNYPASGFSNLLIDRNSTIVNSSWVDIEQFPTDQPRPSLGVFFATPETFFDGYFKGNFSQYSCTIDARWAYTHAILDASSGQSIIFDANPNPDSALLKSLFAVGPAPAAPPSLRISKSWSAALNPPWIDSITSTVPGGRTILDTIGQICFDRHTFLNASVNGSPFPDGLSHRIMATGVAVTDPMPM